MARSLERRVRRLEEAGSGEECQRCSETVIVYLNDKLESVSKRGWKFTSEEAHAFVDEQEEDGRCPLCGVSRGPEIVVGRELGEVLDNLSEWRHGD